jgi:phage terminase large subunit
VGQIYTEWADEVHIIDRYQYIPEWPNYLFFDYGFENPFVALDVQISPSDKLYVWREYYESGKIDSDHAEIMNARPQPEGYKIICGFGDSADPKATETMSRLVCPTYSDPEAKKDWLTGIKKVKDFLAVQLNDLGQQETHLYVDRVCENTIFEFQNYRTKQISLKADENKKEEPKKKNDHSMDAMRYGIMHLFELGARYHLADVMSFNNRPPDEDGVMSREPDPVGALPRGESIFSRSDDSVFRLDDVPRW